MGLVIYSESVARWTFSILIALTILVFIFSVSAYAGELVLVKGKGVFVCEAHLKNLNAMGDRYRMICDRDAYYPEKNNITRQKWRKLDLCEHKELMKRARRFLTYGDQFAPAHIRDLEKNFEINFKGNWSRTISMYAADVDITNSGKAEKLLLYSRGRCMGRFFYAKSLLIPNDGNNGIDVARSAQLLQNMAAKRGDVKNQAAESAFRIYDVFIYKDIVYFDRWNAYDGSFKVYKTTNNNTKEMCRYKYTFPKTPLERGGQR